MRSPYEPSESGRSSVSGVFKRKAEALTRLHICAGWSEALLVAHITLLEILLPPLCLYMLQFTSNYNIDLGKGHLKPLLCMSSHGVHMCKMFSDLDQWHKIFFVDNNYVHVTFDLIL